MTEDAPPDRCNAVAASTKKRCKRKTAHGTLFCAQHEDWTPERVRRERNFSEGASHGFKLTPALIEQFDQVLRAGNYVQTALAYLVVSESSFYRWMQRGEAAFEEGAEGYEDALCLKLWETVTRARAAGEVGSVARLQKIARHADDDRVRMQADQWFLERGHRERWGTKRIEARVDVGATALVVSKKVEELEANPEQAQALIDQYMRLTKDDGE